MQINLQKSFFYLSFDFFSDKLSVKKAEHETQKKRQGTMCVRIKQPSRPVTKNGALLFFEETLQKERKEIREYIELSIPANVFITQFDTVFHIGVRFPFDEIIE